MRSQQLDLNKYKTDKITNHYLQCYDEVFSDIWNDTLSILELGIFKGNSLTLWNDYFPNSRIYGIDIFLPEDYIPTNRIKIYQGRQDDPAILNKIINDSGQLDIIIDDCSHIRKFTEKSFWHLFKYLKSGGIYAIEDWGTGYWDYWIDGGKDNNYGMVGFIKDLIDEQNANDCYKRHTTFDKMIITKGVVFIKKL